jgi:hypothetical protein
MGHEATAWGYVAYINHSHRFMSHGRVVELSAWRAEAFSWLYLDRGVSFNLCSNSQWRDFAGPGSL